MPELASRVFSKLFWGAQLTEASRAIIFITMSSERAEQTMSYMQTLKRNLYMDSRAFPYLTSCGLEAAMRRIAAKQQRIRELDRQYREKYTRIKRLEQQSLDGNKLAQGDGNRP